MRGMCFLLALGWWCALGATAGCLGRGVFRCKDSRQCEPRGQCEAATSACSYPTTTTSCASGWRYGDHAPDAFAGTCVQDACPSHPVVKVRAGSAHACEVRGPMGTVACWGNGRDGQLGDGTMASRSTPTVIAADALSGVTDVTLGGRHTCALRADGTVWCWGANESGQLGDGTRTPRPAPVPVRDATGEPLGSIVQLAAGGAFTCARTDAGQVACWGGNAYGELGQGATANADALDDSLSPLAVPFKQQISRLSARDRHVCAVAVDGTAWCWGSNEQGELGDGSQASRPQPTPVRLPQVVIEDIATGSAHTCALGGGMLLCWGANQLGELGDGTNQNQLLPVAVTLAGATELAAAGHHTCARQSNGSAWCWGANQAGQLGEGTNSNFNVPVPVTAVEDAAELAAGDTFSCARRRNGTVWCWGDNRLGQLGTGANITRPAPAVVGDPTLDEVIFISAGGAHTCAVRQGARALCWGDNRAGQLGDGTRLDRSLPAALKVGLDAVQVVTGALHTCSRDSSGAVWCWGRGGSGQLGTSGLIDLVLPTRVAALTNTTSLAAGRTHSCAILNDGGVRCWGANGDGQLGDGTNENRATPIAVPGVANVVELALGGAHTCARHADGTVSCWGRGLDGQLGDGGTISTGSAVQVRDLGVATEIAAGGNHSCAIVADRSVRCWGAGALGQLGWGTLSGHAVPSKVMNLGGAVRIAAGEAHTCARTSTLTSADVQVDTAGNVLCWGDNRLGQLGNGSAAPDPGMGPSAAVISGDALEIAAGGAHSCATRRDRTTVCWGANDAGQLGDAIVLQYPTAQLTKSPCP